VLTACSIAVLSLVEPLAVVRAAEADFNSSAFMTVSRLVAPVTLNPDTGAALYAALKLAEPAFDTNLQALAKLAAATPGISIEALAAKLDDTHQAALRATLNKVVSAWYLGEVGHRTFAYESALMYRPTADVLSPPSYVRGGPLNWAHSNPPVDGV